MLDKLFRLHDNFYRGFSIRLNCKLQSAISEFICPTYFQHSSAFTLALALFLCPF